MAASIHIGVGGWDFDPWRGTFYPDGLARTKQLEYARHASDRDRDQRDLLQAADARALRPLGEDGAGRLQVRDQGARASAPTAGTSATPPRRSAASAPRASPSWATSSVRSCGSWRRPRSSIPTRSAPSWRCCRPAATASPCATRSRSGTKASSSREFVAMMRAANVAIVFADHRRPIREIADLTADFVYARLQQTREERAAGLLRRRSSTAGRSVATRLGGGREPRGPRLCRRRAGAGEAARDVRFRHQRCQGPQSGRRRRR